LEPSQKGIHPGADDNASGVAAVLEIARILKDQKLKKNSCYDFVAFTGEEIGTSGSSRWVEQMKKNHVKPKAMINLDMVGRMRNNQLIAFGSDSAREWRSILNPICASARLTCSGGGDGYGPSDHMPFFIAAVPVLHFFTGPHLDYHRTSDTADKINATGGVQAARVIAQVATAALTHPLTFVHASSKPSMGLVSDSNGKSNGAYLGTIPDYSRLTSPHGLGEGTSDTGGVELSGVRPGSPAEKAGVQSGDTLLAIDEVSGAQHRIKTLQEFMAVLVKLKPKDHVMLEIFRDGKTLKLPAVVGSRGSSNGK
jgi:hypothetical protein